MGFTSANWTSPVAQVDVPIRTTKFLTVTPSYMYYTVPPSGLNKLAAAAGRIHRQLRRAPVSNRRNRDVRRSQARDLRPQHVCQKVPSAHRRMTSTAIAGELRSRIPSPFKAASGNRSPHTKPSTSGSWWVEQRSHLVRRHAATQQARIRCSRPTCGKAPSRGVETFTTCCSD